MVKQMKLPGRLAGWGAALLAAAVAVTGCTTAGSPAGHTAETASAGHGGAPGDDHALPSQHVHGVGRNPADGQVYLATHDGLFRLNEAGQQTRVGPVIDLMGFAIAGPDHFYASGHPGPEVDLPDPVGLIESTDGGQTWTPLSRQGRSDFHALAFSRAGIVGFDGEQLAATSDGRTWRQLTPPVAPHALTASPDGSVLVISSPSGPVRSTDHGKTWHTVTTPIALQLVSVAGPTTVVGVAPDGRVAVSNDAAATWQARGSIGGPPQALNATEGSAGNEVLAVTTAGLMRSTDQGATFNRYPS